MAKKSLINIKDIPLAKGLRFAVIKSEWNEDITKKLKDGCMVVLREKGVSEDEIYEIDVPGTFELPMAANMVIKQKSPDAVICLGCVIKGQTRHDEYISQAVSKGLMDVAIENNTPVIFGVLTTENMQQALDRAGGDHGNKGIEAASTAIIMARLFETYKKSQSNIGFRH
ncbi:MAG: 6,7-dimethyl-8-ribityllumazine synthase [Saprospiraceae bacterium]|nr:6,7-dimethyl-8-ribityllumazine synthase [Saprospiraceae bacterium]